MIPTYNSGKFKCPHCETVATQDWFTAKYASENVLDLIDHLFLVYRTETSSSAQETILKFLKSIDTKLETNFLKFIPADFSMATCKSCNQFTLWIKKEIIYPNKTTVPPPNPDLNEDIKSIYLEASSILMYSPKGSAALLRLALQMLLKQIGEPGLNINEDIKKLVAKGLDPKIQQMLDIVRVVGNNAVHPGSIQIDDNNKIAKDLFKILNWIAAELITKPKDLDEMYGNVVPNNTKEAIKKRDSR